MTMGQDAVVKALIALDRAEKQFTFYAEEHTRKGSTEKAATNYGFATVCGDALEHLKLAFPYEASNA
jgi:hypothetical protein